MISRDVLSREHGELEAIAKQLLAMLDEGAPTDGLSALRWRLNHRLMVHLAKEDKLLYPALAASPATRGLAQSFADEMGGLAEQYLAYNAAWPIERVAADWAGFGAETRAVLGALRQRVLREERDLYPRIEMAVRAQAATSPSIAPCRM